MTGHPRDRGGEPTPALTWTTTTGDTAEVYLARPAPGNPQKWYWRVVAANGEKVAASGEAFTRRRSARRACERLFPPAPQGRPS